MTPDVLFNKPEGPNIIAFYLTDDRKNVMVVEQCDAYYSEKLTKAEFREFIADLTHLCDSMKD